MALLARLENTARRLKAEMKAIYIASRDPRTPWYAKLLAVGVVAYALSPVDLIPDWIPVLGLLDDLILVPLGIALVLNLLPREVLDASRERVSGELSGMERPRLAIGFLVIALWIALGGALAAIVWMI